MINFCCLSHPDCVILLTAVLSNESGTFPNFDKPSYISTGLHSPWGRNFFQWTTTDSLNSLLRNQITLCCKLLKAALPQNGFNVFSWSVCNSWFIVLSVCLKILRCTTSSDKLKSPTLSSLIIFIFSKQLQASKQFLP